MGTQRDPPKVRLQAAQQKTKGMQDKLYTES